MIDRQTLFGGSKSVLSLGVNMNLRWCAGCTPTNKKFRHGVRQRIIGSGRKEGGRRLRWDGIRESSVDHPHKIWPLRRLRAYRGTAGHCTACGKTNDADALRIDAELFGALAHQFDRSLA